MYVRFICIILYNIDSVQFSCSVMSDSLQPHESQHTRPPCPSPTPGVYSNSCPLSRWCHPTISFSIIPFSSCLQTFPASGSFQMSQFLLLLLLKLYRQNNFPLAFLVLWLVLLPNASLCTQYTVKPNKLKPSSLEQRWVHCRAKKLTKWLVHKET